MGKQKCRILGSAHYRCAVACTCKQRNDTPKQRAKKEQLTSTAQKILNTKRSKIQLAGIVDNIADDKSAMFVTLTFKPGEYEKPHYVTRKKDGTVVKMTQRDWVNRQLDNFKARARTLLRKRKKELFACGAIGGGNNIRYHIHIVTKWLSGEDLRALWEGYGNVDYHPITARQSDPDKWDFLTEGGTVNPMQIAEYLYANASANCGVGQHPWWATSNCERPEIIEEFELADREPIPIPADAEILSQSCETNQYAIVQVAEYLIQNPCAAEVHKRIHTAPGTKAIRSFRTAFVQ